MCCLFHSLFVVVLLLPLQQKKCTKPRVYDAFLTPLGFEDKRNITPLVLHRFKAALIATTPANKFHKHIPFPSRYIQKQLLNFAVSLAFCRAGKLMFVQCEQKSYIHSISMFSYLYQYYSHQCVLPIFVISRKSIS